VYDTAGDVIGVISDSVRTGVDEADISAADAWIFVKDGAQLAVAVADIGFDVSQTALAGGSCTVKCAFTASQKEKFPEEHTDFSLVECLGTCGSTFASDASEITANVLDGVATMLEGNACGHVDTVADVLGATLADLGSKSATAAGDAAAKATNETQDGATVQAAVQTLTAGGATLFSGALKGACDVMQCAGIAAPSLANAVRDGLDPKQILVDLDEAIVTASDGDCAAYKTVVDGITSLCSGEALAGGCTGCQSALDDLESDFETASLNCAANQNAIAATSAAVAGCIGELTELDDAVADLFEQEESALGATSVSSRLVERARAAAAGCQITSEDAWWAPSTAGELDGATVSFTAGAAAVAFAVIAQLVL
jgi:hypothetical protein